MPVEEVAVAESSDPTSVSAWDAGRSLGRLVVAWRNPDNRLITPIGLLEHGYGGYRFRYLRRARQVLGFRPFLSFPDWDEDYRSEWLSHSSHNGS